MTTLPIAGIFTNTSTTNAQAKQAQDDMLEATRTAVQTDDARLTNSRKCNNTFDDPAVARSNLGIPSTSLAPVKKLAYWLA
jgi:hypothetical protein